MERTTIQLLHDAAKRYGERAYTTKKTDKGWEPCSFRMCDEISDKVGAALVKHGMKSGSTAGLISEGRPEWVNSEFSIFKARGVSVPLSIRLTPEEIAFRQNHSEAHFLVCSSNVMKNVTKAFELMDIKPFIVYLDEEDDNLKNLASAYSLKEGENYEVWSKLIKEGEEVLKAEPNLIKDLEKEIKEDDLVNICYTSGTTGNPKGIMLTHLNYWANSKDAVTLFNIPDATYETLVVLPTDHSFAHTVGIYAGLQKGITLHFVDARGSNASIIRNFPKNLTEVNPTFLLTVPSISGNFMKKMKQGIAQKGKFVEGIFNRGLEAGIIRNGDGFHKAKGWDRVRTWFPYTLANLLVFPKLRQVFGNKLLFCVGGGALLEAKQQHFFAAIGTPVYQGYGLTEAAPIICSNTPARHKFGSSGNVAPSVTCKIMKDETHEAKVGERGEIVIKGDNVMKGYYKNPEASAKVLRDGWLWTEDLGYYDEDGFLVVTGRAKALLISKDGEKYSPEEVEEVMNNCDDCINQLIVYNDHQAITTALVTLQEDVVKRMIKEKNISTPHDAYEEIIKMLNAYEPNAKAIPAAWHPGRYAIIERPFGAEDGLVNSTMKIVRYKCIEFYKDRIDQMYQSEAVNDAANIEVIKKLFF